MCLCASVCVFVDQRKKEHLFQCGRGIATYYFLPHAHLEFLNFQE